MLAQPVNNQPVTVLPEMLVSGFLDGGPPGELYDVDFAFQRYQAQNGKQTGEVVRLMPSMVAMCEPVLQLARFGLRATPTLIKVSLFSLTTDIEGVNLRNDKILRA